MPVPGRPYVLTTDEIYGTFTAPFMGCPWGWARLIGVADPSAGVCLRGGLAGRTSGREAPVSGPVGRESHRTGLSGPGLRCARAAITACTDMRWPLGYPLRQAGLSEEAAVLAAAVALLAFAVYWQLRG